MKYIVQASAPAKVSTDCVVVLISNKAMLSEEAQAIDIASNKVITKLMRRGDFDGKLASTLLLHDVEGIKAKRVLLVGGGDPKKLTGKQTSRLLRAALKAVQKLNIRSVHFALSGLSLNDRDSLWVTSRLAQECEDCAYRYRNTISKKPKLITIRTVSLAPFKSAQRTEQERALRQGQVVGKAINRAKELGNLPGNVCTPAYLAEQARLVGKRFKAMSVEVLGEKSMQTLGMGSLLSVAAGSSQEGKLIVMSYQGANADDKPYALVGKGITFDTGGISLKPGAAMDEMKFDMCGAASVLAVLECVAALRLPINVIGIIAAAENMPSGKATKPGDVVTSMSGKTIEILNTDAEGRLVLCDALTYAERYKPQSVIDIATLTGAAVMTFGSHVNVLLSNNEELAKEIRGHGSHSLDPAWQLPLWDEYQDQLKSNFADIANIGGPRAGTITAACFLSRFTEKYKWAHLDIAGSAWHSGKEKGATGRPVALLVEYLRHQTA